MSDFPEFTRLRKCRHGTFLYNSHDRYIGRSLDLYGEYSESETEVFRKLAFPGAWVLEVGSNIGALTVVLASIVGPTGRVFAFEPQRIVFQTLCANVVLNSLTNVHACQAAVAEMPGHLVVPVLNPHQSLNFGGLNIETRDQGELVPVITIDGLGLPRCDFIKIDVEGMEGRVLAGAVETIARLRPPLYLENDRADRSDELVRQVASLGYRMYWHFPPLFNVENFCGNRENVFGQIVSKNMLCLHSSDQRPVTGLSPVDIPD